MASGYHPQQSYFGGNPSKQGYQPQHNDIQYNPSAPTTTVIVRQSQTQPNDYLAFAIIVTICCCLPFGIVAIVKSMDVRTRFMAGDVAGAEEASRSAKSWSIAGLVTGIVLFVIGIVVIIIYVVVVVSVVTSSVNNLDNVDQYLDDAINDLNDALDKSSFFNN